MIVSSEHDCSLNVPTDASRLILHVVAPSDLIPILTHTGFSSSLVHLTAHPAVLLTHIATAYLTPPPPRSSWEKYWGVFLPIAERYHESERLVVGSNGDGSGGRQFIVEVLLRASSVSGRGRGVERVLEGWLTDEGNIPCELGNISCLNSLNTRNTIVEKVSRPCIVAAGISW